MPRPVYIVCSESGAEDTLTRLLSLFNVIEKIQIKNLPSAPPPGERLLVPTLTIRTTAVWMKTENDVPDQEYEFQTVFCFPPDGRETVIQEGRLFFNADMPFARLATIVTSPPFPGPGLFRVLNRIRRVGTQEWLAQDYPIVIEREPAPASDASTGTQS